VTSSAPSRIEVDQPPAEEAVSFSRDLGSFGPRPALVEGDGIISYGELSARVGQMRSRLAGERRLVHLRGSNTVDTITAYLAALSAGHAVLIAPNDKSSGWLDEAGYDPDIVLSGDEVEIRRPGPRYPLHPDLALLLSTSGSTGSGKLVRLSRTNLEANAESIATYLEITDHDRAVTTLPLHYCYGLSVVNSYLLRGASLVLTDASVADAGFWEMAREQRVTSFAGVPHTFELLERVGFEDLDLPDLRYATQAGGRMAPDRVCSFAALGRERGWRLYVMYGQTEATARMAYLPPDLAEQHPGCVGVAIPGGTFRIDPLPDAPAEAAGELVYSGPNVMLGYAEGPADLAEGRVIDELRTGDIARLTDAGLVEIVGRRSRFLKLFGLRIDLQQVEDGLASHGYTACCVGDDQTLQVAVAGQHDEAAVRRLINQTYGLPAHVVEVRTLPELPRLESGKIDYTSVRATFVGDATLPAVGTDLRAIYALVLNRPDATEDDTFVSLGGDSLSYVEMTVRLEQALDTIPTDWHVTPIRDLRTSTRPPRGSGWLSRIRRLETSVGLRALTIVMIIGEHIGAWDLHGAAHALLAVVGYNFARFSLSNDDRLSRVRSLGATIARIVAISVPVIAAITIVYPHFTLVAFFENRYVFNLETEIPGHAEGEYWFIFALLYIELFVLGLIAVPWVHRIEQRYPFGVPIALVVVGLVARYQWLPGIAFPLPAQVFWLFALGWAVARARRLWQRAAVSVAVAVVTWGFIGGNHRYDGLAIVLVLLLVWLPWFPSTRLANRIGGVIAASTLATYLTHWQVAPVLEGRGVTNPLLVIVVCLVVGAVYFKIVERVIARGTAWLRDGGPHRMWSATSAQLRPQWSRRR